MGILRSFRKALGSKDNSPDDKAKTETPPAASELTADQEDAATVETEPAQVEQDDHSYTVRSGDTLWSIAELVYGDGSKHLRIFDANSDLLKQPDRVVPGQKLHIPDLEN